jgi:hypothetical protein
MLLSTHKHKGHEHKHYTFIQMKRERHSWTKWGECYATHSVPLISTLIILATWRWFCKQNKITTNTNTSAYFRFNCMLSESRFRVLIAIGAHSYTDNVKSKNKQQNLILEMKKLIWKINIHNTLLIHQFFNMRQRSVVNPVYIKNEDRNLTEGSNVEIQNLIEAQLFVFSISGKGNHTIHSTYVCCFPL